MSTPLDLGLPDQGALGLWVGGRGQGAREGQGQDWVLRNLTLNLKVRISPAHFRVYPLKMSSGLEHRPSHSSSISSFLVSGLENKTNKTMGVGGARNSNKTKLWEQKSREPCGSPILKTDQFL